MKHAIDLDGVIHDHLHPVEGKRMGAPMEGAVEAITALRDKGDTIIVHTVKATTESGRCAVIDWLNHYNIPFDDVTAIGEKLHCIFDPRQMYSIPYERFNELRPEVRQLICERYPNVTKGEKFLSPNDDQILTSFINHSDEPNYDQDDTALTDIRAGEEITEDYRSIENYETTYPWLSPHATKSS